jgi:hypothetical protein
MLLLIPLLHNEGEVGGILTRVPSRVGDKDVASEDVSKGHVDQRNGKPPRLTQQSQRESMWRKPSKAPLGTLEWGTFGIVHGCFPRYDLI